MGRSSFTFAEKKTLWERWRAGESLSDIARLLNRAPGTIFTALALHGGIAPCPRRRSERALSFSDREEISRSLAREESVRAIARRLDRSPSTITRELERNGGRRAYRAVDADKCADSRARRPKRCKLASNARLRQLVARKLELKWSPEQIAGWLKQNFDAESQMRVSHETIYRSLFVQARGVLKKELQSHLRTHRPMRRSRKATTAGQKRGQIIDAVSISERPASVEDRAVPGHWEGDLITGSANSHVATLVERKSRFTMLVKVAGKDSASVIAALNGKIQTLPIELMRSLTWDRGTEMARHKEFAIATDIAVYFCDPQSPWQRGTNENTNGLLRQYFPKGTNIGVYTQADLNKVARELNARPRKTLDYQTPAHVLRSSVAMTS